MSINDQRIGLIGLGNMGSAIATALLRDRAVVGFDLDEAKRADAARQGAEVVDDLAAFGQCEIVILCLPSPVISRSVAAQLVDVLPQGAVIIETSTVNPHDMRALAELLDGSGIRLVESAILSGVGGMALGKSILLTAGEASDIDSVRGVLEAISAKIIPFGAIGTAMTAKVVNNAVAHAVMVVLIEAMAMAKAEGLEIDAMSAVLEDPEAGLTRPLTHRIRERVANREYVAGMPTDAARKDSVLALELAQAHHIPMFAIQASHTVYELAVAAGLGRDDYAAIATLWPQFTKD